MSQPLTTDERFDQLNAKLDEQFSKVNERFEEVQDQFSKVNERFEEVQDQFSKVNERFEEVQDQFSKVNERFEEVQDQFSKVNERFEEVQDQFSKVDHQIDRLAVAVVQGFERIDKKLEEKANKADLDRIYGYLDKIIKQQEIDDDERVVMGHQLERLDRWAHEIANKIGYDLVQ